MSLSFTKMHGLGNDFIIFEAPSAAAVPGPDIMRRLADRRTGIGFDQALAILPPRRPDTDIYYQIFNADGSEVEQCGNGARCVAQRVAGNAKESLRMDSAGGVVEARLLGDGRVSIDMGVPSFAPASLPFEARETADWYDLEVNGEPLKIGAVSMGNPHTVIQVADVNLAPVDTLGPAVENHPRFPRRVNVGFMAVIDAGHIRLRVFERGVGETQACGTGACAAVAVGRKRGVLADTVQVDLPGGRLTIQWPGPGERLWMTGPTVKVFEGRVDIE